MDKVKKLLWYLCDSCKTLPEPIVPCKDCERRYLVGNMTKDKMDATLKRLGLTLLNDADIN